MYTNFELCVCILNCVIAGSDDDGAAAGALTAYLNNLTGPQNKNQYIIIHIYLYKVYMTKNKYFFE